MTEVMEKVVGTDVKKSIENIQSLTIIDAFEVIFEHLKSKEHHISLSHICYTALDLGLDKAPQIIFYAIKVFKKGAGRPEDADDNKQNPFADSYQKFKQNHLSNVEGEHKLLNKFKETYDDEEVEKLFSAAVLYTLDKDYYKESQHPSPSHLQDLTYYIKHGEKRSKLDKIIQNEEVAKVLSALQIHAISS